jgi:hypothetical protein
MQGEGSHAPPGGQIRGAMHGEGSHAPRGSASRDQGRASQELDNATQGRAGRGTSSVKRGVIRGSRSAGRSIRGGRSVGIDIDLNAQGQEDDEPIEVEAEITANNSVSNFLTHGHC